MQTLRLAATLTAALVSASAFAASPLVKIYDSGYSRPRVRVTCSILDGQMKVRRQVDDLTVETTTRLEVSGDIQPLAEAAVKGKNEGACNIVDEPTTEYGITGIDSLARLKLNCAPGEGIVNRSEAAQVLIELLDTTCPAMPGDRHRP